MKTRRAVAKRFTAVGNGKLKRAKANLRHILEKRSQKRKNKAGKTAYVHEADYNKVKRCLPYV
nr:50S ribosomal protein L35 [Bacteriovorax sp. BSW11_IV]